MTELLQFVVPGHPVAKQRARTFVHRQSGRVVSMTPAKTKEYEAAIRAAFIAAYPGRKPITGPVELRIRADFQAPQRMVTKTKTKAGEATTVWMEPCDKRPDIDNVAKAVMDALNGLAWKDDGQVSDLTVIKRYALAPCVLVEMQEIPR